MLSLSLSLSLDSVLAELFKSALDEIEEEALVQFLNNDGSPVALEHLIIFFLQRFAII